MMTCTSCEREIKQGDAYIAFNRRVERVKRNLRFGRHYLRTAITVKDAEELSVYHPACAPDLGAR